MLNFDNNHQSVEGNINAKNGKSIFRKIVISGLVIANLLAFSGCERNVPCDINGEHAHYYVSDENLGRYIVSEKSSISGLKRTDKSIPVSKKDEKLLDFEEKHGLFKITENQKAIDEITGNQHDHMEYRYEYFYVLPQAIVGPNNSISFIYIPHCGYSWTESPNKDLTGEKRECHYVYYGYKVIENEKGDFELIRSEPVDSLSDLPDGYNYIKEDFYDVVNVHNKNEIFNYEDGTEEDKQIISREEYNQLQGKSR